MTYGRLSHIIPTEGYCPGSAHNYQRYMGMRFRTTKGRHLAVMIEETRLCCEDYGYTLSAEDTTPWLGKELIGCKWVNGALEPSYPPLPIAVGSDDPLDDNPELFTAVVELTFSDADPLRVILYNYRRPVAYSHDIFKAIDGVYDDDNI
jgi:hypothetical protein